MLVLSDESLKRQSNLAIETIKKDLRSGVKAKAFFELFLGLLAKTLKIDVIFVGKFDQAKRIIQSPVFYNRGKLSHNVDFDVHLSHERSYVKDLEDAEGKGSYLAKIQKSIDFKTDLGEKLEQRLLEIADRCPVHKTLSGNIEIQTKAY